MGGWFALSHAKYRACTLDNQPTVLENICRLFPPEVRELPLLTLCEHRDHPSPVVGFQSRRGIDEPEHNRASVRSRPFHVHVSGFAGALDQLRGHRHERLFVEKRVGIVELDQGVCRGREEDEKFDGSGFG